jgi:beta-glucosidase
MQRRTWIWLSSLAVVITGFAVGRQVFMSRASHMTTAVQSIKRPPFQDFLWGVSTAGYQSEGGEVHSNWARWQPQNARIQPAGRAVDFWNRYDEDMARAESLGVNAFRLSVEWSRLEPTPGKWDESAIAHYQAMFKALKKHHLQPVITLSHWTMPAWVDDQGGWTNPEIPRRFGHFVEVVATRIAPEARYWLTFNEPNVWLVRDYLLGLFPPNRTSYSDLQAARGNVVAGHALAYDVIHRHIPQAMVTANLYHVQLMTGSWLAWPLGPDLLDNQWNFEEFRDAKSPDGTPAPAHGRLDFLSYDYYYAFRTVQDILNLQDPWLLPVNPAQLADVILSYHRRFGLPQLIAENGLATENGQPRPDGRTPEGTLLETVDAMRQAQAAGANLIGYCYWTLTDNYEWGSFVPRFGLFAVDHTDPHLQRRPTATAETYRRLIRRERKRLVLSGH